jgi:hypothetical protein
MNKDAEKKWKKKGKKMTKNRCPYLDELMRPGDQLQAVQPVELQSDTWAKEPSSSSWGYGPVFHLFRIAPHQVAEGTLVRNLLTEQQRERGRERERDNGREITWERER